jgi:hypothetical protein
MPTGDPEYQPHRSSTHAGSSNAHDGQAMSSGRMRRSLLTPLVWLLTIALSLALGAWAARVAMTPPAAIGNSSGPALYNGAARR